jgi:DNA-binding LytR/AlgR family response regulator
MLTPVTKCKMQEMLEMIVHKCKRKCFEKGIEKKREIFDTFYNLKSEEA